MGHIGFQSIKQLNIQSKSNIWSVPATDISVLPSINPDGFARAEEGKCSGTGWEVGHNNYHLYIYLVQTYLVHLYLVQISGENIWYKYLVQIYLVHISFASSLPDNMINCPGWSVQLWQSWHQPGSWFKSLSTIYAFNIIKKMSLLLRTAVGALMHQDFPTADDHRRFQTDYQYDPYEDRQTETRVCFFQIIICTWYRNGIFQN